MKRIISLLLLLVTVALLASCGGTETVYSDSASATDVLDKAGNKVETFSTLAKIDNNYLQFMVNIDPAALSGWDIRLDPNGATLDEVGVLKATAETLDSVKKSISDYLEKRNADWTGLYLVDEYPKLENAEYKVFGNYVVYAILSDADKQAFFTAAENALKAN